MQALHEALSALAFTRNGYGHDTIGEVEAILTATPDILLEWYEGHYSPDNAFVIVAGDFDPYDITDRIEEHFGSVPKKSKIAKGTFVAQRQVERRKVLVWFVN